MRYTNQFYKMEKTIPLTQLKTLVFFNVATRFDLAKSSSG